MPDQDALGGSTECTGYTPTDLAADIFKRLFSPDWQYAMNLWLQGAPPNVNGSDAHIAMLVPILRGLLPASSAPFNALSNGELFCANWRNWPLPLNDIATAFGQNGVLDALGNGDPLSSILSASSSARLGVSVVTPWFAEWEPNGGMQNNILPMPKNPMQTITPDGPLPWHNYVCKGQKTINGQTYGVIKSWQGSNYGDGGFVYMGHDVAQAVFENEGSGALIWDPQAIRVFSEMKIIVERFFPLLFSALPSAIMNAPVGT